MKEIDPNEEQRARQWVEDLTRALKNEEKLAFAELWQAGLHQSLWKALGYDTLRAFCRVELAREFDTLLGTRPTEELPPQHRFSEKKK